MVWVLDMCGNGVGVGFFQLPKAAQRRLRIRSQLPTVAPAWVHELAKAAQGLPEPVGMSAEELAGALAAVSRVRNRLDAYLVHLAGAADTCAASSTLHAGTTGMLVATATGSSPQTGSAMVGLARALRDLPVVDAAFTTGNLSAVHAGVIAENAPGIDDFADAERAITDLATLTDPTCVRQILQTVADQHNPTRPDLCAADQRAKRGLRLSARPSGMWRLSGLLDALDGARLSEVLARFTAEPAPDTTAEQRRADALADLAAAAAANTRPLGVSALSVLVDITNLHDGTGAHLPDGTPMSADQYQLLACATTLSVIFGIHTHNTFVPLALARTHRRASAAQWAALIARDGGCIRCGRAPRYCHAHHIHPWAAGGLTDIENLALLCARCHHDLHHGRYTITVTEPGIPTITIATTNRAPPTAAA